MKYSLIAATLLVASTFAGAQQPYRNYAQEMLDQQRAQQAEQQREQREAQQRQQEQWQQNEQQRQLQNRPMCTTYHRDPLTGQTTAVTQPCNAY